MKDTVLKDYQIKATLEIWQTSEQGDKLTSQENVHFVVGQATGEVLTVHPEAIKQKVWGIGTSFTESSAFVLAHLPSEKRNEVMQQLFSDQGANFSLARTPIGSCDFCVHGKYSYADVPGDTALTHFSVCVDEDGFDDKQYPGVQNSYFDVLPMIHQAQAIKNRQQDALRLVASAWSAPPWMKDIEDWYCPPHEDNQLQGTGGVLKPEYESVYADYLVRYLEAYKKRGVEIWGMTPVNEPLGNNGQWESLHFNAVSQNNFIKNHLGPKLHAHGFGNVKLYMLDHARDQLADWASVMYHDAETAPYLTGAAVHWYESTFKVYEEILEQVHQRYPEYEILHTEGCIDDLGNDASAGIADPEGFKESGWFQNDEFWWHDNATDWAYSATWPSVNAEDHPRYTPVHRYARNIIVSLNHWLTGWIDWNCVLNERGGPNHVANHCGAPIMVDTKTSEVYYTPVFYVLAQLSRSIRPGDSMLQVTTTDTQKNDHTLYVCASRNAEDIVSVQVLNTSKQAQVYQLQIGMQYAHVEITANALQTVRVQLPRD